MSILDSIPRPESTHLVKEYYMSPEAQHIINLLSAREAIPKDGSLKREIMAFIRGNGWFAHEDYYNNAHEIRDYTRQHPRAVIELILSNQLDDTSIHTVLSFMGGVGVGKEDNPHMVKFYAELRTHYDQLNASMKNYLDWLLSVHGY